MILGCGRCLLRLGFIVTMVGALRMQHRPFLKLFAEIVDSVILIRFGNHNFERNEWWFQICPFVYATLGLLRHDLSLLDNPA